VGFHVTKGWLTGIGSGDEEGVSVDYTYEQVAKMIDHSMLNPVLTDADLESGCEVARKYEVTCVFVKPCHLKRAAAILATSGVKPSTTIGFPHAGHTTGIKVSEVEQASRDGGLGLDMVVNVGKVLSGDWEYVTQDMAAVVDAGHTGGALVKVIFENYYLEDKHKMRLCQVCGEVGADWVRTATGYAAGGATVANLKLMRR
jgi:deoxyribose-phosphate aldolase